MSFPVPGTLMIEPTELGGQRRARPLLRRNDRDPRRDPCDRSRRGPAPDNVLKNAPHTGLDLADEKWVHPDSRMQACFPMPALRRDKYWAPVNRLDNAYGDRHPICTCPMPAELENAAA